MCRDQSFVTSWIFYLDVEYRRPSFAIAMMMMMMMMTLIDDRALRCVSIRCVCVCMITRRRRRRASSIYISARKEAPDDDGRRRGDARVDGFGRALRPR